MIKPTKKVPPVLFSDNEEELKSLLQHLHEYCTESKLTINHDF